MVQTFPDVAAGPRDIPIIGEYVAKIGRVKSIYATPCDDPGAYLAALGFFYSAPYMIWSLFGPDCIDLVDERRGKGHRTRRGLRWRDGHMIPGSPPGPGWGWRIFRIGDLVQRAGWYLGVADATTDFIINWMTLPMIWNGCPVPGAAQAHLKAIDDPWALIPASTWFPMNLAREDDNIFVAGTSTVAIPQGYDYASAVHGQFKAFPGFEPPSAVNIRVVDLATDRTHWEGGADDDGSGNWIVDGIAPQHSFLHPATTLQIQYMSDQPLNAFDTRWDVSGVYTGVALGPAACGNLNKEPTPWFPPTIFS